MHRHIAMYQKLSRWPLGKALFSAAVCFTAPYFGSIRPRIEKLEVGLVEVSVRNRRSVRNHIRTVHAIAMANACELSAGMLIEVSLPSSMRWIPRGMQINYLQKAESNITARAKLDVSMLPTAASDVVIPVEVFDEQGMMVVSADITMYVTPRPTSGASGK